MSLKGVHVLLVSLSAFLALGFAAWAWTNGHPLVAAGSVIVAIGLACYVVWFSRKIKSKEEEQERRKKLLRPLPAMIAALWWLGPQPAHACAVCYGQAQGSMIDAARLGVWLLFALVFLIQLGFVLFFVKLWRRSRDWRRSHPGPEWVEP